MEYAKVFKLFKDPDLYDRVMETLFSHYMQVINIFDFYAGKSEWPRIGMMDMSSFASECKILDHKHINIAELDLILVATNVSVHKYKKSAERDINRYEMFEFIVRTAQFRYIEQRVTRDICEGIEMLLEEYIYPNARFMNGEHFRKYYCYNIKTNEVLQRNQPVLKKLYESFCHSKKKYIELWEMKEFVIKIGLKCSQLMVGAMYAESMMTIIDNMSDNKISNKMSYVEWLVLLCRLSDAHYEQSEHSEELLYKKLDHLMPLFLGYVNIEPIFLFNDKF